MVLMPISLVNSLRALAIVIWPSASVCMIMVMVWLSELPLMLAMMGINAASVISLSIESLNVPIMREATNAVMRLSASQV